MSRPAPTDDRASCANLARPRRSRTTQSHTWAHAAGDPAGSIDRRVQPIDFIGLTPRDSRQRGRVDRKRPSSTPSQQSRRLWYLDHGSAREDRSALLGGEGRTMTVAICMACGAKKFGALSDHHLDEEKLAMVSATIRAGQEVVFVSCDVGSTGSRDQTKDRHRPSAREWDGRRSLLDRCLTKELNP